MRNILFVHQSADLYGSDNVLLALVSGVDRDQFHPIVLLPCDGPLRRELAARGIEVHVVPLVKISRSMYTAGGLLRLPVQAVRSLLAIRRICAGRAIAVVHSNTVAVLSGGLWAALTRRRHIWHVHEMIVRPRLVRWAVPLLVRLLADDVVCNSVATRELLLESQPTLTRRTRVIWNGLAREKAVDAVAVRRLRERLGLTEEDVLIALVGRINAWKGHLLLLQAFSMLGGERAGRVHLLMVGSAPEGQEYHRERLVAEVSASSAPDRIHLMDFTQDVWTVWDACDIAAVPSTDPEPFGMVALEAMASAKPVVAAGHGGLTDIVVHGETGLLFTPNDAESLADALRELTDDRARRERLGLGGQARWRSVFSLQAYVTGFEALYRGD